MANLRLRQFFSWPSSYVNPICHMPSEKMAHNPRVILEKIPGNGRRPSPGWEKSLIAVQKKQDEHVRTQPVHGAIQAQSTRGRGTIQVWVS